MKPNKYGMELTERDEFVVVGQAYIKKKRGRLDDDFAVNEALGVLRMDPAENQPPHWSLAKEGYLGHLSALGTVEAYYEKLQEKEDPGSYCENASHEYSRLWELRSVASGLTRAIQKDLGVPEK